MTTSKSSVSKVAVGAGIAAIAAAAAGTYFFYGSKNAAKHRKQVKAWSVKAKGEVLEQLENLKEVNETVYRRIVDEVAAQYEKMKTVNANDIAAFAKELKSHWGDISKEVKKHSAASSKASSSKKPKPSISAKSSK